MVAEPPVTIFSIYAELLSNIRQVSVRASLGSPSDSTTKAAIIDDGLQIEVHHRGEIKHLSLPARVAARSSLQILEPGAHDLAWRLPVSASETQSTRFSAENQAVPWSSLDIKVGSRIGCRTCHSALVEDGIIKTWKDLPSENWAEMMEFWHCHKPHDHQHRDGEALSNRGYGANSTITAQPGVGLVDLVSFMFSEPDCRNLSFSHSNPDAAFDKSILAMDETALVQPLHVFCKTCCTEVGLFNIVASSVTLFKWQVVCDTTSPSRGPSSSECLAATLIATLSRSGSSKSVISPSASRTPEATTANTTQLLHLWLLNANVVYTSTLAEGKRVAIKVLYQDIDADHGNKLVESMTSGVQEISFPASAIEAAESALRESNGRLPSSDRLFQQWNVGLLERWV